MEYIKRHLEEILQKAEKTYKAVLVTGARQTGKSTLIRNVFPDRKMLTFDDQFLEDQANDGYPIYSKIGFKEPEQRYRNMRYEFK